MALPPWCIIEALEQAAEQHEHEHPGMIGGNLYNEAASAMRSMLRTLKRVKSVGYDAYGCRINRVDEDVEQTIDIYEPRVDIPDKTG